MIDWIINNYVDVGIISILFFMPLFMVVNKIHKGIYGSGLIIFAVVICSALWVIAIPYCVFGFVIDFCSRKQSV